MLRRPSRCIFTNDAENDPRHYKLSGEGTEFAPRNILVRADGDQRWHDRRDRADQQAGWPVHRAGGPAAGGDANIIGVAIENARLFEFVRQRRERLERCSIAPEPGAAG